MWKMHGDVEDQNSNWVFPGDSGVVFDELVNSLSVLAKSGTVSIVLIVGYSESEINVKTKLIDYLEENFANVIRIRPNIGQGQENVAMTSVQFFKHLLLEMKGHKTC